MQTEVQVVLITAVSAVLVAVAGIVVVVLQSRTTRAEVAKVARGTAYVRSQLTANGGESAKDQLTLAVTGVQDLSTELRSIRRSVGGIRDDIRLDRDAATKAHAAIAERFTTVERRVNKLDPHT